MKDWMRKLWHPNYGNWCGAKNTHDKINEPKPIDIGDGFCMIHDFELRMADKEKYEDCKIAAKKRADANLYSTWKAWKPKRFYAKIYRRLILLAFKNEYC